MDHGFRTLNDIINLAFPFRTITVTNNDPKFVTPHIKSMLRQKNALMRRGKVDKANAIATRIGLAIERSNSLLLRDGDRRDSKKLWERVRLVTGQTKQPSRQSGLDAETLNMHYAAISTDDAYVKPCPRETCSLPPQSETWPSEYAVFRYLDALVRTSAGPDGLSYWALKLGAPYISAPISHLYQISIRRSLIPEQWRKAKIIPVAKVTQPTTCSDFRPISLTSILSRTLEKLIVRRFLYPAIARSHQTSTQTFQDQYAYRPTGSTTSAIIAINQALSENLQREPYVHIIAYDFSKAFDTVRLNTLLAKVADLDMPDHIFNWVLDFFSSRQHSTYFQGALSAYLEINASIVQGTGTGPVAYTINAKDLMPLTRGNQLVKYADDTYLIVPASNSSSIPAERENISVWALQCNLKINTSKTYEMIVKRKGKLHGLISPPLIPDIKRVNCLKILGVTFSDTLSVGSHVSGLVSKCNQNLYALKILRAHGLHGLALHDVCRTMLMNRLAYASPAWAGFATKEELHWLQSVLKKARRWGLDGGYALPTLQEIHSTADDKLFRSILRNPDHVLHHLLPPITSHLHNLRPRRHNRQLEVVNTVMARNFMTRMLHHNVTTSN